MAVTKLEKDSEKPVIEMANPAMQTLLQRSPLADDPLPTDLRKLWVSLMKESKNGPGESEFAYTDPGGRQQYFTVWVLSLNETRTRFLHIMRDVTKERLVQNELEQAVKMRTAELQEALHVKDRFLAVMSHEIRTPLAGILGSIEILEETVKLRPDQCQLFRTAKACTEQLSALINDILDLASVQAQKVTIHKAPFSAHNLLDDVVQTSGMKITSGSAVELVLDIEDDVPDVIVGDETRLRQILNNLVSNAIKFTEKGEVCVRATCSPPRERTGELRIQDLKIAIQDTGIGISPEGICRLFKPFSQGDSSITRRYGGTGLGLSISAHLTQLLNGKLTVESKVGHGSLFELTFPAELPETPARRHIGQQHPRFPGLKVVVVDPHPLVTSTLLRRLKGLGCCASAFTKPAEAVEHLQTTEHRNVVIVIISAAVDPPYIGRLREIPCVKIVRTGYEYLYSEAGSCLVVSVLTSVQGTFYLKKPIGIPALEAVLSRLAANCGVGPSSPHQKSAKRVSPAINILVAEDNVSNQLVIRRYLEILGHSEVMIVENGLEAVERAKTEKYDLILMDLMYGLPYEPVHSLTHAPQGTFCLLLITLDPNHLSQMPVMDGVEATKEIRRLQLTPRPLIVGLTEDRERCFEAGMDEVLTKPLKKEELRRVLNSVSETRPA